MIRMLSLLTALVVVGAAHGQEKKKEPTMFEKIEAAVGKDKPFTLAVSGSVKADKLKEFAEAALKAAEASQKEKGCVAYEFHMDTEKPGRFLLFEKWTNLAALEEHMKLDHTKAILKAFGEFGNGDIKAEVMKPLMSK